MQYLFDVDALEAGTEAVDVGLVEREALELYSEFFIDGGVDGLIALDGFLGLLGVRLDVLWLGAHVRHCLGAFARRLGSHAQTLHRRNPLSQFVGAEPCEVREAQPILINARLIDFAHGRTSEGTAVGRLYLGGDSTAFGRLCDL